MASRSDNEDERPRRSDEDVFRDEEDAEALIHPQQGSWLSRGRADPNQPRAIPQPTPRELRRQERRDRHAQRRQRRRGGNDDEAGLLFGEEEKNGSDADDDIASIASEEALYTPPVHRGRKRFRIAISIVLLLGVLAALVYGAYLASVRDAAAASPSTTATAPAPPADDTVQQTAPEEKNGMRSNGTNLFAPTTIFISLDGFRADFLARDITPNLDMFIRQGVSPKYMLPSFPSLTFPNHWTLVTGLYPESHGVVGNSFWDPALQEEFWYTDPARSMDPKWWTSTGAQPLWATAEEQGVRAAVHMWPGSEAGIEPGPTYLDRFNGKEALSNKVERVLGLLDKPSAADVSGLANDATRPALIGLYVPNVDTAGHRFGPNSTEIRTSIGEVDTMLGDLLTGLESRNLRDIVNVVVVSDHGMATVSPDLLFQYEDLISDPSQIEHIDGWPLYGLRPAEGADMYALFTELKSKTGMNPFLSVYLREEMPAAWHFNISDRIAPLWIVPKPGAAIVKREDFDVHAEGNRGQYALKGLHGYDNRHPLMRAIFAARGPAFPHPPHSEVDVFQNIDVYNIVCDSIRVEPRPNNGTLRLPLKPLGVHAKPPADAEAPTDPPPPEEADADDNHGESEQTQQSWWDAILGKLKDTWGKVQGFFSNGGGEVVEVIETDEQGNPTIEVIEEPAIVIGENGEIEIVEEPVAIIEIEPEQGGQ